MPEQTDNHGWVVPVPNQDDDWGIILNDLIKGRLDVEVIQYGTPGERPDPGSDSPALFFDTNNETLQYNDGTSWSEVTDADQYTDADVGDYLENSAGSDDATLGSVTADGATLGSVTSPDTNTMLWAGPGEIQAQIDAANSAGGGKVVLHSQEEYDPAAPIDVKDGVVLDYNGAWIKPTTDQDILRIKPGGRVRDPRNDVTGITFTSNVFYVHAPDYQNDWWHDNARREAIVKGGEQRASFGDGRVLYLHTTGGGVSMQRFETDSQGFDKAVDIHQEGDGSGSGFITGNTIRGRFKGARIGVHIRGQGGAATPNGNLIEGNIEPRDAQKTGTSDWAIDMAAGDANHYRGKIWDPGTVTDNTLIRWQSTCGGHNTVRLFSSVYGMQHDGSNAWVNNSGYGSNGIVFNSLIMSSSPESVSVGEEAATGTQSSAVGMNSDAGNSAAVLGWQASASGSGTAMGREATSASRGVAIGRDATGNDQDGVAVGYNTTAEVRATALGEGTSATGGNSVAIGHGASAGSFSSVAIGNNASMPFGNACRVGVDQLVFGGVQDTVSDSGLNNQEMTVEADEANSQFVIRYKDSGGTVQTATLGW